MRRRLAKPILMLIGLVMVVYLLLSPLGPMAQQQQQQQQHPLTNDDTVQQEKQVIHLDVKELARGLNIEVPKPKPPEKGQVEFVLHTSDEEQETEDIDKSDKEPHLFLPKEDDDKIEETPELQAVRDKLPITILNNATKVLLFTYYRGGSTFVGELFNKNPNAFYWFEPLGGLLDKAYNKSAERLTKYRMVEDSFSLGADGISVEHFPDDFSEVLIRSIVKILNCDFADVPKDILKHYFITSWGTSAKFGAYGRCVRTLAPGKRNGTIPDDVIDKCIPKVIPECLKSNIRSLKTIRMAGFQMKRLLRLDPSIKIIHYIRDPRGLLNSRWAIFGRKNEDVVIKQVCGKMRDDMDYTDYLVEMIPEVFHQLRYEDFAQNPMDFANYVYKLIGHDIPPIVTKYVIDNTHASSNDGVMGTKRANASAVAIKWRHKLPPSTLEKFREDCMDIIKGYEYPTDI